MTTKEFREMVCDTSKIIGAVLLMVILLFILMGLVITSGTLHTIYFEHSVARVQAEAKVAAIEILNDVEARAEGRAKTIIASAEAQAKEILSKQFKSEDAYLRYLWIKGLTESKNQVIYVQMNENGPIVDLKKVIKQGQIQGESGE